jgi:hypothetical protein
MMKTTLSLSIVLVLFSATAAAASPTPFELKDQYDKSYTQADIFSGKPVIMIAGMERKTPDAMEAWDKALREKAPKTARVVGFSNLEGVPFFVPKGSISKTLKKQMANTVVLCDWEGHVYKALGFPKGAVVAIGVFDASGKTLGVVRGEVNDERMAEVLALLLQTEPPQTQEAP